MLWIVGLFACVSTNACWAAFGLLCAKQIVFAHGLSNVVVCNFVLFFAVPYNPWRKAQRIKLPHIIIYIASKSSLLRPCRRTKGVCSSCNCNFFHLTIQRLLLFALFSNWSFWICNPWRRAQWMYQRIHWVYKCACSSVYQRKGESDNKIYHYSCAKCKCLYPPHAD